VLRATHAKWQATEGQESARAGARGGTPLPPPPPAAARRCATRGSTSRSTSVTIPTARNTSAIQALYSKRSGARSAVHDMAGRFTNSGDS
jgi:hypothetical protein